MIIQLLIHYTKSILKSLINQRCDISRCNNFYRDEKSVSIRYKSCETPGIHKGSYKNFHPFWFKYVYIQYNVI